MPPTKATELAGRFIGERQRWGDTSLANVEVDDVVDGHTSTTTTTITIKGKWDAGELREDVEYTFSGRWFEHHKYGRQFLVESFTESKPAGEKGVIRWLIDAPGIGHGIAKKLWDKYGADAINRLKASPAAIAADLGVKQFTVEKAVIAAADLRSREEKQETMLALLDLFAGRGLPRKAINRCIDEWGLGAPRVIKRNPYVLLRIHGCGFLRADRLYLDLGHNPARVKRQVLCLTHAISTDMHGHSWFSASWCEKILAEKISSADVRAVRAVRIGKRAGLLAAKRVDGQVWVTSADRAQDELNVAGKIALMQSFGEGLDGDSNDAYLSALSDHQREKLKIATSRRIGILGGSPGTGKTFTAAAYIKSSLRAIGESAIAICAPTGKAAVRITESMAAHGVNIRATTIHSLLKPTVSQDVAWCFAHNAGRPLPHSLFVVDETSMVSTDLLAAFLAAVHPHARILFVGDVNQLPPVGHGAPLRDMIAAGVPMGELREIRRNSGAIVETCAKIRDEEHFSFPGGSDWRCGENLTIKDGLPDAENVMAFIKHTICTARGAFEIENPIWDVQVIVPVNDKSPLSRIALNKYLQARLNPNNHNDTSKFWIGDKVVCLRNGGYPLVEALMEFEEIQDVILDDGGQGVGFGDDDDEDGSGARKDPKCYVANGELGRVLEDFPNRTIVEFDSPRRVVLFPRGKSDDGETNTAPIDLAYAISCHRGQGSEFPIVIVVIDDYPGARLVCDRAWVYTAISRAKRACVLVGRESTLRSMVARQKIDQRKTFLAELIEDRCRSFVAVGMIDAAATTTSATVERKEEDSTTQHEHGREEEEKVTPAIAAGAYTSAIHAAR